MTIYDNDFRVITPTNLQNLEILSALGKCACVLGKYGSYISWKNNLIIFAPVSKYYPGSANLAQPDGGQTSLALITRDPFKIN